MDNNNWYFTSPWDPIPIRRGDALGFRGASDYFADLLAPGLSNGTYDARWLSILCWCLQWSEVTWLKAGGSDLLTRAGQKARYTWLRPLELLWIARTLKSGQDTGQLPGKIRVTSWLGSNCPSGSNFDMSADQFQRYRQSGIYGAYRVALRNLPGLTTGDGWTLGETGRKLADLVNKNLPKNARLESKQFENGTKWGTWVGKEACFWIKKGWINWSEVVNDQNFLPYEKDVIEKLPNSKINSELNLIKETVFPSNSVRKLAAEILSKANARSHAELCDVLAESNDLSTLVSPASLKTLPTFTRFADAAMAAMQMLWQQINQNDNNQTPTIQTISTSENVKSSLKQTRQAGDDWLSFGLMEKKTLPRESVVTELAQAMKVAKTPVDQIRALAKHHEKYGGGRRWFHERDDKLIPLIADKNSAASDYRFRLAPLVRLAAQCGVGDMTSAYDALNGADSEEADDE